MSKDQSDIEDFIGVGERHARLDSRGREILDPTPVAPPLGYKRAPTLAEQMREMIRSEALKREVMEAGFETFEEADDFEIGDDYDPSSPYEQDFDPTPVAELRRRQAAATREPPPPTPATPRQGAAEPPASGGAEGGLDGPAST